MRSVIFSIPLGISEDVSWISQPKPTEASSLNFINEPEIGIIPPRLFTSIVSMPKHYENGDLEDVITYREKRINRKSSLCWMETIVITEDKICCNKNISKEYAIILDSPSNIPVSTINPPQYSSDNNFWGAERSSLIEDFDRNNMKNSTRIRETENTIITEHRKLICGAGPVLTKQYFEWPNSRRERIEIKIGSEFSNVQERKTLPAITLYDTPLQNSADPFSIFSFTPTTETSSTFDTIKTPVTLDFAYGGPTSRTEGDRSKNGDVPVVGKKSPANISGFTRQLFPTNSEKKVVQTLLLRRNISYQNTNHSQTLRNPFDNTDLVNRLKKIRKPILFHLLFPNDNIFNNLTGNNEDSRYVVTVKLLITISEKDQNNSNSSKNAVTLQLIETSMIVISNSEV